MVSFHNGILDFPGSTLTKNLPANARDRGLIPGGEDFTCHRVTKPLCCNY